MNEQIQSAAGEFAKGCGSLLKQARENAGMSRQDAASQLKMPERVLESLEGEHWSQLGAPVFVRGQLRSYAKLLKVDIDPYLLQAQLQPIRPAELISHSHTPRYQRVMESIARRAVYVVITAAIAVPVWVATQSHIDEGDSRTTASLDVVPGDVVVAANRDSQSPLPQAQSAPYVASLTPPLSRNNGNGLILRMTGDSWVQVTGPDGITLEKALLKSGEERSYRNGQVSRVVLGNASAVEVQQAGSRVDMAPYKRANVARFAVSSDGSLAPVAD
ncbi:MAG: RodZ domain-containing protein [Pseudoxanthomonas sp.]